MNRRLYLIVGVVLVVAAFLLGFRHDGRQWRSGESRNS